MLLFHAPIWRTLAIVQLLASLADAASVVAPTNSSLPGGVPLLNFTAAYGATILAPNSILPLSTAAQSAQANALAGYAFLATPSTQLNIISTYIAFISCDPQSYSGNIDTDSIYTTAVKANAVAIVFYSNFSNWCQPQNGSDLDFPYIYSMTTTNDTGALLYGLADRGIAWSTQIGGNRTNATNNTPALGGGPTSGTALAMVVLYAITGVITALFVLIIVTGTVRAHRHPERYGPSSVDGRRKRTRAGGLARAMLDTIPVVKFGERVPPKPTDVELGQSMVSHQPDAGAEEAKGAVSSADPVREETEDGIATASGSAAHQAETSGCSICTEDFEVGQDQRVLPCDHRFHPACIDPWLLNVSGTCPLCRIDLRAPEESEPDDDLPEVATRPTFARRRSVMVAITGTQRPDRMSREERLQALRRYIRNRRAGPSQVEAGAARPSTTA